MGYNKPPFNSRTFNNKRNEHNGHKLNVGYRCGLEDHFITNCLKMDTSDKKVHWSTKKPNTCAYISIKIYKMLDNITGQSE